MLFFYINIPHNAFVNNKGKVQTHTFTNFPPTTESNKKNVYNKTQIQNKYTQSLYSLSFY